MVPEQFIHRGFSRSNASIRLADSVAFPKLSLWYGSVPSLPKPPGVESSAKASMAVDLTYRSMLHGVVLGTSGSRNVCAFEQQSPAWRGAQEMWQLGLIVPGLGQVEIFDVICGVLASLARVRELGMHWGGSAGPMVGTGMRIAEAEELCERYIGHGVSGVFFAPFEHTGDNEAANRRITERLSHAGIPVVLLDRDLCPFPKRSNFDLVGIDNFAWEC